MRFTPVLHEDVVEIERVHSSVRRYMCKQCGLIWEDTITSLQNVIEEKETIDNWMATTEHVNCTDAKAWTKTIQIGKRYLLQMKGYQPLVTVVEYCGGGLYKILIGNEYREARKEHLLPWCGEKY